MMEIFRILDELELLLKESRKVPFSSGKTVVETNRFLDRLDRIRAILPEELETARIILSERERLYNEACSEAEKYVEQSRDQVARMMDNNEIVRNAREAAEDILARGENEARQLRVDANEYVDGLLSHMEIVLRKGLDAIMQGKDELKQVMKDEKN